MSPRFTDSGSATATNTPDRTSRQGPSAGVTADSAADGSSVITLDWHSVSASAKHRPPQVRAPRQGGCQGRRRITDDRKLEVLRAIVTDYVSSQEPVGSKSLVERHDLGVSPATVRNDMAALEEEGYITQPHTSAGRIPTDKGYRLFVDRLGSLKPLSPAEQRAIQTFLSGALDLDDVLAQIRCSPSSPSRSRSCSIRPSATPSSGMSRSCRCRRLACCSYSLPLPGGSSSVLWRFQSMTSRHLLNYGRISMPPPSGIPSPQAAVRLSKLSGTLPPSLQIIGQAAVADVVGDGERRGVREDGGRRHA